MREGRKSRANDPDRRHHESVQSISPLRGRVKKRIVCHALVTMLIVRVRA